MSQVIRDAAHSRVAASLRGDEPFSRSARGLAAFREESSGCSTRTFGFEGGHSVTVESRGGTPNAATAK